MPPLVTIIFWVLSAVFAAATMFVGIVQGFGGLYLTPRMRKQIEILFIATVLCFVIGLGCFLAVVL